MGNLLTSVFNSANAIRVYDRQLAVLQNNIANANTPGYVRRTQSLEAMRFDLDAGLAGGVWPGPVLNSRSEYAEGSVRDQFTRQGYAEQKAAELARIEPLFDVSTSNGLAGSITRFFTSFSQLAVNPNNPVARQSVIDGAHSLAAAFNQTAGALASAGRETEKQIRDVVDGINRIGAQIREVNAAYRANSSSTTDAGLDAKLHSALEELSEHVDFSLVRSEDGTLGVYLGGQTALVLGDQSFPIKADWTTNPPEISDSEGEPITGQFSHGKLTALLDQERELLPSFTAGLNRLAKTLADQVNSQLAAGLNSKGSPPTTDLFRYVESQGAAMSLAVTDITPDQIAAAASSAPGGNGNALDLAAMGSRKSIDDLTYVEYFGGLGGRLGRSLASARDDADRGAALTNQARSFREEVSGVSLDQEAAQLIQIQRAYEANGRLMQVLNEISDTLIQALR